LAAVLVVHSPLHALHDPASEVLGGMRVPMHESPDRAEAIRAALAADPTFTFTEPSDHGTDAIAAVHDPGLVDFLANVWSRYDAQREPDGPRELITDAFFLPGMVEGMGVGRMPRQSGLGSVGYWIGDTSTPIVEGTYRAARSAVDVALESVDRVLAGDERVVYGLCRPPGHHAAHRLIAGYCFFNNAAIAAHQAVEHTHGKVVVLDVDYHHGNGTQQIFYGRDDVMYVSLHGDPDRAYPYFVGYADETGAGKGAHANLNLPLPLACDDRTFLDRLDEACEAAARFRPEFAVVSLGVDTYREDPLSDLDVTQEIFGASGARVADLGLPMVVLQEGGYFGPQLGENVRLWLRGTTTPSAAGSTPG
jgi:acetoin utilization deacetylase AcuC-like enzyme